MWHSPDCHEQNIEIGRNFSCTGTWTLFCHVNMVSLPPHFVLLNIQHDILHSERSPFLAVIGEHERTHIHHGFIIEGTVADILQETQWHCHCTVPTQNACPHILHGKMACLHLLVTLFTA
jgi:hypothetical protein